MGKWAPDNYMNSGMSKGAYLKSQKGGGSSSGGDDIDSIINEILGATPGFSGPDKTFDEFYTEKQQKEDAKLSEEMFNPYYEQQISDTMEDLTYYMETDSVDYKRTLRQGRAKMAQAGGAIGSERTGWEGEVTDSYESNRENKLRGIERRVGSDALKEAGYTPVYGDRKGSLIDERNAAIEEQKLWYRNNAYNQYSSGANASYKQPSPFNVLGGKL